MIISSSQNLFSNPFIYHYFRIAFSLGFNTKYVKKFLSPFDDDFIIDIGCGIGYYSTIIENAEYLGVDINKHYLKLGQKKYGTERKKFKFLDIKNDSFENINFKPNKALLIGVLHHLNDYEIISLFNKIIKTKIKLLIIQDPIFSKWHLINNLICYLDRGEFIRSRKHYGRLIKRNFHIVEQKIIYERNLLSHHLVSKVVVR